MNHGSNRAERYIRTLNDILCRNLIGTGDKRLLFVLPSCWAMNTQVSQVTGYSPYEMVYHVEPPDLFNFDYKPGKNRYQCYNRAIPRNNEEKEGLGRPVNHR